jgi:hypothetical protein
MRMDILLGEPKAIKQTLEYIKEKERLDGRIMGSTTDESGIGHTGKENKYRK